VKKRLKKMFRQHPDVFHLNRKNSVMYVYAVENLLKRWYTGEEPIDFP